MENNLAQLTEIHRQKYHVAIATKIKQYTYASLTPTKLSQSQFIIFSHSW